MTARPDGTAVRVALWRAAHLRLDRPPHVLVDELGLRLADPGADWLDRPDLGPGSGRFRAAVVARSRLAEDVVAEAAEDGVRQYVILGAGLDTFVQREASRWPDLRVRDRSAGCAGLEAGSPGGAGAGPGPAGHGPGRLRDR